MRVRDDRYDDLERRTLLLREVLVPVVDVPAEPNRRERLRAQTLLEIKEHALAQVAEGGADALSLNAVARAMRMSGPAIYRYFSSREELLTTLVAEASDDLADALQATSAAAAHQPPPQRVRAIAAAYRHWAIGHPHRYRLVFASRYGSGLLAPDRTIPAAHRSMTVFLEAIAALGSGRGPTPSDELTGQLYEWAGRRSGSADLPAEALQMSVLAWTRLHGLVSLEIEGAFAAMELDPSRLFDAELDYLVGRPQADMPALRASTATAAAASADEPVERLPATAPGPGRRRRPTSVTSTAP